MNDIDERIRDLENNVWEVSTILADEHHMALTEARGRLRAIAARLAEQRGEANALAAASQTARRENPVRSQAYGAPPAATVEQIAGIIRDKRAGWRLSNNESCTQDTAREIATLFAAPGVPAEIVERAKEIVGRFNDARAMSMHEDAARSDALRLVRDLAAQPSPAPDPAAVELAKRLPSAQALDDFTAFSSDFISPTMKKYRQPLADAAAYVRRAAGMSPHASPPPRSRR